MEFGLTNRIFLKTVQNDNLKYVWQLFLSSTVDTSLESTVVRYWTTHEWF